MSLDRFLLDTSFTKNLQKIDDLYREIYTDDLHTGHPMELYRYINLNMSNTYQIFAISDLHADVRRFLEVLKKGEFINLDVDMAYPLRNLTWSPKMTNKIIVICGDIIDGKRKRDNEMLTQCDELLIHMLIFNLRILARAHNSYVFCTMGNHDFFAFHSSTAISTGLIYRDYIDSRSLDFYENKMDKILEANLTPDEFSYVKRFCSDIDLIYMYRTYLLSRFYLIGYPPFLKINKTLFAHAGFHFQENILLMFEENSINSQVLQPQFLHRDVLEQLADFENTLDYLRSKVKRKEMMSYSQLYNFLFEDSAQLIKNNKHTAKLKHVSPRGIISPYDRAVVPHSLFYNLFLTRQLQTDCRAVDEILALYGCNSLIVGHCPTCMTHDVFNPANTVGITSCNDARIVYSCDSKLVTVDIAMSSAFSPDKQFLEMLEINNVNGTVQNVSTIRFHLDSDMVIKYNEKMFDGQKWNIISGLP